MEESIEYVESEEKNAENELERPKNESGDVIEGEYTETHAETMALTPYDQMAKEWSLPDDDKFLLVHPPEKSTLTWPMVAQVESASKRYAVPLSGFNLIRAGGKLTLYINADGMNFRLQTDPRGLKSIETFLEHMPDLSKEADHIAVRARITMGNGEFFDGWGVNEWPPTGGRNSSLGLGDLTMKLETKATRRATIKAVGKGLPVQDDDWAAWIVGKGRDAVESPLKILKPKKTEPTTLNELIVMAGQVDESLDVDVLIKMMDVNVMDDLRDIVKETWDKIQEEYRTDAED